MQSGECRPFSRPSLLPCKSCCAPQLTGQVWCHANAWHHKWICNADVQNLQDRAEFVRDVVSLTPDPVDVDTVAHFLQPYMLHTAEFGPRDRDALLCALMRNLDLKCRHITQGSR